MEKEPLMWPYSDRYAAYDVYHYTEWLDATRFKPMENSLVYVRGRRGSLSKALFKNGEYVRLDGTGLAMPYWWAYLPYVEWAKRK